MHIIQHPGRILPPEHLYDTFHAIGVITGIVRKTYQIEVNPYKMEQYDITLGDITEKIEKNNVNAGGLHPLHP